MYTILYYIHTYDNMRYIYIFFIPDLCIIYIPLQQFYIVCVRQCASSSRCKNIYYIVIRAAYRQSIDYLMAYAFIRSRI